MTGEEAGGGQGEITKDSICFINDLGSYLLFSRQGKYLKDIEAGRNTIGLYSERLLCSVEESRTRGRDIGWQVPSMAKARFSDTLGFGSGDEAGEGCMSTNEK